MRIKQITGCEEYLYVLTDKDTIDLLPNSNLI